MSSTVLRVPLEPSVPSRRDVPRPDVVRPLSRAAARSCSRPGCPSPAAATLTFVYADRQVVIDDLADERIPSAYDLCVVHADRTAPPHGWELADERRDPDVEVRTGAIGGARTVALIAEVLGRDRADGGGRAEHVHPALRQAERSAEDADVEDADVPDIEDLASSW